MIILAEVVIWFFLSAIILLPLLAIGIPLSVYLTNGWSLRRHEIVSSFRGDAIELYFQTFFPTEYDSLQLNNVAEMDEETATQAQLKQRNDAIEDNQRILTKAFEKHYTACFGRRRFFPPILLLFVVACVLLIFCALTLKPYVEQMLQSGDKPLYSATSFVVVAGFMGGLTWVLQFIISRMQERQLSPPDLCWSSFRLLVSVPIALALSSVATEELAPVVAYLLGAFPMQTLMSMMRRLAVSKLEGLKGEFEEPGKGLVDIQGIDKAQAERFALEGVGTNLQLAYADPVDLTIRTGFSFSFVVDCCSQALASIYFESDIAKLRKFALRGAMEFCTFSLELDNDTDNEEEYKWAVHALPVVAKELGLDHTVFRRTIDEIAYDPYTQFLHNVWQSDWN